MAPQPTDFGLAHSALLFHDTLLAICPNCPQLDREETKEVFVAHP
jgi:hypothetical protein